MAKLARKHLTEPKGVKVENAVQVSEELVVISFVENDERYDDIYNAKKEDIENILRVRAGSKVEVTVAPDGEDADGHPQVTAVTVSDEGANTPA
jgi:hypothetical protein